MLKLVFLFVLLSGGLSQAEDLAQTRVLPWSAFFLRPNSTPWNQQDLQQIYGSQAETLFSQAADLKIKNSLRCGNNSSILDTNIPSLGNKKITTRFHYNLRTQSLSLDIFVNEDGTYRELARTSYFVYSGEQNYGRLKRISMVNLNNQSRSQVGWINRSFLTELHSVLGGEQSQVETNSPFARDWLKVLEDNDQGFTCCFNHQCRDHLNNIQPEPAPDPEAQPQEIRRAEAREASAS